MPPAMKPILLDLPDQIETERLIIRAPRPGDGPPLAEAVRDSQAHLQPWMPWAQRVASPEEYEALVREGIARWTRREDFWMMLIRKADGRWIGGSGLHDPEWDVPRFEIGYWVRADEEGKGYISEAVRAITDFAFVTLRAERLEIRCDALNRRSRAVAERCGFTLEGRLRRDTRAPGGELRDTLVFGLIRPDWEARRAQTTP